MRRKNVIVRMFASHNIIRRYPVAEVEESRPISAVIRFIPGGEGETSSARGEGAYVHILSTGSGEQQLVVGDRGAVH